MLQEKINQDIKKAMQEKAELLLLVLRGINAAIHNKEIEKTRQKRKAHLGGPATIAPATPATPERSDGGQEAHLGVGLTDEEVVEILMSEAKKRREAIEAFGKGNRQDLVDKETKELEIIKNYLPEQISKEQVREEAKKVIAEIGATGPQDTGKVMSAVMPKLKGKTEGGIVSKIVGELLKG